MSSNKTHQFREDEPECLYYYFFFSSIVFISCHHHHAYVGLFFNSVCLTITIVIAPLVVVIVAAFFFFPLTHLYSSFSLSSERVLGRLSNKYFHPLRLCVWRFSSIFLHFFYLKKEKKNHQKLCLLEKFHSFIRLFFYYSKFTTASTPLSVCVCQSAFPTNIGITRGTLTVATLVVVGDGRGRHLGCSKVFHITNISLT